MKYSTVSATTTTAAEIINPWIIGLMPDFLISLISVFIPKNTAITEAPSAKMPASQQDQCMRTIRL